MVGATAMITYQFNTTNPQNFPKIISTLESNFSALMHTVSPLPTSLTYINGAITLSSSPSGNTLYVHFYDNSTEYQLKDISGNVIYQSKPLSTIPTQSQVQNAIGGLL